MPVVNDHTKELRFKIVYCGAGFSGKTTNLRYIHQRLAEDMRGELISLATAHDRTLFFDFLPIHSSVINGYHTKFQLYTVPGQVVFGATRQMVLKGVDGLVFVVDSDPAKMEENKTAFESMCVNIRDNGDRPANIPIVIQFNKRDIPNAVPLEQLQELFTSPDFPVPSFEAVAEDGYNVFATLSAISQQLIERFFSNHKEAAPQT